MQSKTIFNPLLLYIMQYLWKIINIGEITKVWQNALDKRTVVLEEVTDREYKGGIAFDLIKDKVYLTDKFKVWDTVEVFLNFKVSEYNGRHFTNITAWKIEWKETSNDVIDESLEDLPF